MSRTSGKVKINLGTFNLVKGFAMIMVFVGHMHSSVVWKGNLPLTLVFLPTYVFRAGIIPLFMLVTGFGFKETTPGKQLQKTFRELLLPYLFVAAAVALIRPWIAYWEFGNTYSAIQETKRILIAFLLGIPKAGKVLFDTNVRWIAAAWYLWALFWAMNITNLVLKIRHTVGQIAALVLCGGLGYSLFAVGFNYYCIPQGLLSAGYCYLGYQLKKRKLLEALLGSVWTYLILVPVCLAQVIWGYYDLCYGVFNNIVLDYFGAGCFGLFLLLVSIRINAHNWKCLDWLREIGCYTYWILMVHTVEMLCFTWVNLTEIYPNHQFLVFLGELIFRAGFVLAGCWLIKKLAKYHYKRRSLQRVRQGIS